MTDEKFSPEQSLQLIQTMISKTKQDMSDDAIHFLVWGWITFIACIGQFILKNVFGYEHHYYIWSLVFVGVGFNIWYGIKYGKKERVKTYIGDSMKYLWIGMGLSYFVLSAILTILGWHTSVFPFFILLYGLGTFVSGNILRFKPLQIGGIIAWGLAISSAFVEYDYQMLFGAAAILISYIIPAYMLRNKNKKANQ
jgi:hypothetical protein